MLNSGKVYAFETDTVWGLGADIKDKAGVLKIYELKHRETQKPLILMSNSLENIEKYIEPLNNFAIKIINKYFPGALTLIVNKSDIFPKYLNPEFATVGIRIPSHKGFQDFCKNQCGIVLATTSANISGELPLTNANDIEKTFKNNVEILSDTVMKQNMEIPSTVVLVKKEGYKVLRQGAINIKL